jgi:hypothetical protein
MIHYTCESYRPVRHGDEHDYIEIDGPKAAARVFAARFARKRYGRRGAVATVRLDHWHESERYHTFEAFVGRRTDDGGVSGRNEWFTVYVEER